jgi:hypothetical protein
VLAEFGIGELMPSVIGRVAGEIRFRYHVLKDPRFAAWCSGRFIHKEYHVPCEPSELVRVPICHPQTGELIENCLQYAVVGVLRCVEQADERGNSDDHIRLWLLTDRWGWSLMVEAFKGDFKYAPKHDGQETARLMFDGAMAGAWQLALEIGE